MGNYIKIFLFLLLFISCKKEYFLVRNDSQLERVKDKITDLNWKISDIDTFWNIDGKSILKYRIIYRPKKATPHEIDSLMVEIKNTFNLNDH